LAFGHFEQVQRLNLAHTEVSSAGLHALGRCPVLVELDLSGLEINEDVVSTLVSLPRLERLRLVGCKVEMPLREKLRKRLVNCAVEY
jgi:hypothetical protein